MDDHASVIQRSDPSIFSVESQTSLNDRRTLLDLQNIMRMSRESYVYLEIGSHLGGTLIPHLCDPKCRSVLSVDPRPSFQPDERGTDYAYENNSTARMISILQGRVPRGSMLKLRTFDIDATALSHALIGQGVDFAFIDEEHTNRASFRDFLSVLPLLGPHAMVAFHDSNLIFDALTNIETTLRFLGRDFSASYLHDHIYAIGFGDMRYAMEPLQRFALDTEAYVADARRHLQRMIATNAQPASFQSLS